MGQGQDSQEVKQHYPRWPVDKISPVSSASSTYFCLSSCCLPAYHNASSGFPIWVHTVATAVTIINTVTTFFMSKSVYQSFSSFPVTQEMHNRSVMPVFLPEPPDSFMVWADKIYGVINEVRYHLFIGDVRYKIFICRFIFKPHCQLQY